MNRKWTITADKFLTIEQIEKLLLHLKEKRDLANYRKNDFQRVKDYYQIRTLLESGLRLFELCALKNEDLVGHKLFVKHGKGNKARTVLLTKSTANLLKDWIEVKKSAEISSLATEALFPSRLCDHQTTRALQYRIALVFKEVGLPKSLSGHSLRHTYCSLLLDNKVGLATARDNMGHSSINTTNLYSHALGNLDDVDLLKNKATSHFSYKYETRKPKKGSK